MATLSNTVGPRAVETHISPYIPNERTRHSLWSQRRTGTPLSRRTSSARGSSRVSTKNVYSGTLGTNIVIIELSLSEAFIPATIALLTARMVWVSKGQKVLVLIFQSSSALQSRRHKGSAFALFTSTKLLLLRKDSNTRDCSYATIRPLI